MRNDFLVEKAKNGSQKAFKELFELNVNNLYRYLKQFTKDSDKVDDWVQCAFIKAFNNINSFNGNSTFSTWLFRIGINEMRSDFRKFSNKNSIDIEEVNYDNTGYYDNNFEWHDEMKWLLTELDELKKCVFILYEVEEYSHMEISEMLGISESSSKTILHRTKKILQEKWNKR